MLGFVAHIVFWALLAVGCTERGTWRTAVLAALWVAGYVASQSFLTGGYLFTSAVAIADVVLLLLVAGRDLRLT
jgi:hypothetical protein